MNQYAQELETVAVKQRFESFRLGGQRSPTTPPSTSSSVSSSFSHLSLLSISTSSSSASDVSSLSGPSAKRNSHHRRRSSVSTRRESADIMGVAVPDLPPSSDNNVNLGGKDSVRRRALWALEGKQNIAFNKVEIPELTTPDIEKRIFDFPSKPSFPPGQPASTFGSGMASKRDSFKLLSSSLSSKDHLHTLIEEEEEEDTEQSGNVLPAAPVVALAKPSPSRPRPATLVLRPLTLASAQNFAGLPTPTISPSPINGLKSLSLNATHYSDAATRAKRSSLPIATSAASVPIEKTRKSSISYRKPPTGLATPEMTPSPDRRFSGGSNSDDEVPIGRPLSASEQHFIFKSHNALLARITDLENALSSRPRSRPTSCTSEVSEAHSSFSDNDEMLRLIADLKAERDELNRDADGWRQRVSDLDKQVVLLSKRIDSERRDAWVARSQIGLVEVEKAALVKVFETKRQEAVDAKSECERLNGECNRLTERTKVLELEITKGQDAQAECISLRAQLQHEQQVSSALQLELQKFQRSQFKATSPFVFGRSRGFASVDSESSMTDVECASEFPLKSVAEETEEEQDEADMSDEEDNGLSGYEDQEDSDENYGSSLGSDSEFEPIRAAPAVSIPVLPAVIERPAHAPRASLSKTWTFPTGPRPATHAVSAPVDRFFECLNEDEDSPLTHDISRSYESSKNLFAMGFKHGSEYFADDDDMPPFIIPSDVGEVEHLPRFLDAVIEEDEEEEEKHDALTLEDTTLTLNKGQVPLQTTPTPIFSFQPSHGQDPPFNFGRPSLPMTPPPSVPRLAPTINTSISQIIYSSPPSPSTSKNAFLTPPNKRGGMMPSLIPIASPPPSPVKIKTTLQRKPVPTYEETKGFSLGPSPHINTIPRRSTSDAVTTTRTRSSSLMLSVDLSAAQKSSVLAEPVSSPSALSSRLSRFTSFIPISSFLSNSVDVNSNANDDHDSVELQEQRRPSIFDKKEPARFVTKKQQLDKLQARMKQEQLLAVSSVNGCASCTGDGFHI